MFNHLETLWNSNPDMQGFSLGAASQTLFVIIFQNKKTAEWP
jgi:hypothetical protein